MIRVNLYPVPQLIGLIVFPVKGCVHPPLPVKVNLPSTSPLQSKSRLVATSDATKRCDNGEGVATLNSVDLTHELASVKVYLYTPSPVIPETERVKDPVPEAVMSDVLDALPPTFKLVYTGSQLSPFFFSNTHDSGLLVP